MLKKILNLKFIILIITAGFILCFAGFFLWANDYYHADDIAITVLQQDSSIEFTDNLTIISPSFKSNTGIIFYPGAKVEAIAYMPLLEQLKEKGYTCILVEMPLRMAIFDADAADEILQCFPEIKSWYIAGHSMGGAMASSFAAKHPDKVDGLILMGAYIYGDYPPQKTLTVYGTLNADVEKNIHYTENIIKIEGGNHAQFGNYGKQKGDLDATIPAKEQQKITVNAVDDFIKNNQRSALNM